LQLDLRAHAALSRESIAGYDVLEDIEGDPALLLRIDAPRPVYQQGQAILLSFGLVILVMGLLAGVIIGAYQQRLLLSRLEKAEDRHRAVVEQAAEAFLLIDPEDMQLIDANRAFYRLFGFSPHEMSQLTLYDLDSGSRGEIDAAWRLACQGDQQSTSSRRWRHNDGHVVDVEMGASPINLGKRKVMSCVVRDVSEHRKAEQALRSSEERFRGVFENTLIGIYQIAPDGRVLFANRALAHILGFRTPEDMVQSGLDQNDGSAHPGRSLRRRIDEAGEIRGHVSFWKSPNGSTTRARENARAVRDPNGAVRYYEGTVEDITELVDAQESSDDGPATWRL
jgi:PAS domain S-box-containing protein